VIERYGAPRAFDGGLQIKTTLDLELQRVAEHAIEGYLAYSGGPTASLVAIENSTGEVRAMVGGRDYNASPFNLATEGERQPGSSFKAFDLAGALEDGISPDSTWASKQKEFIVPHTGGHEKFIVHNDEGAYTGSNTLIGATAYSDNSIYAEVGLQVGTERIARLAHRMGITTPISTNPAMTIGGLKVGVTPLDMAHAYETIAHDGRRVSGTLALDGAPVGIQEVISPARALPDGSRHDVNRVVTKPVLPPDIASTETSVLETVLQYGTARSAAIGQFAAGKTGTTSNYGDAWFVGWDSKYTVAVWVGYPNGLVPMTTQFNGGPVLGGTFPALIWHDFMTSALHVDKTRAEQAATQAAARASSKGHGQPTTSASEETLTPSSSPSGASQSGEEGAVEGHSSPNNTGGGGEHSSSPSAPAPSSPPAPAAPSPAESSPAPKGGGSSEATGGVSASP
jgi:penicillin-binding protein 1A